MILIFHGEIIDYDFHLKKDAPYVIFLHGWGCNKFSFNSTVSLLKKDFSILALTITKYDLKITFKLGIRYYLHTATY